MFIRYYVEIPRPSGDVEAELTTEPGHWLTGPARDAEARGEDLLAAVGFGPGRGRVEARVLISFGEPVRFASKTILPMSWEPAALGSFLPQLDADIEVAPLGAECAQLSISARYRPPLGAVGRVLDRALLHRVAEATVKDFLDHVGIAMRDLPAAVCGRRRSEHTRDHGER
jgi:hypothetical protein